MQPDKLTNEQQETFVTNVKALFAENENNDEVFATKDGKAFLDGKMAVEHAVILCPGNPEVLIIKRDELKDLGIIIEQQQEPIVLTDDEKNTKKKALQTTIDKLTEDIFDQENDDAIDQENTAVKLHIANLKKQLEDAENELKELQ